MFYGKQNYGEFLSAEEGISTNILADRLSRLEASGIVTRETDPDHRAKFIYRLTKKGQDLLPVMLEVIAWSSTYDPDTAAPRNFGRKLLADRAGVLERFQRLLKRD